MNTYKKLIKVRKELKSLLKQYNAGTIDQETYNQAWVKSLNDALDITSQYDIKLYSKCKADWIASGHLSLANHKHLRAV